MKEEISIRQQIENSALALFSQNGVKSINMDDIAHKAGISKKTLYEYFENKEKLLISIVKKRIEQTESDIQEILNESSNPINKVMAIYRNILKQIVAHRTMAYASAKFYPSIATLYDGFKEKLFRGTLKGLLTEAKEMKILRSDISIPLVCDLYYWSIDKFVSGDFHVEMSENFDLFLNHLIRNNLRGMLTKEYFETI